MIARDVPRLSASMHWYQMISMNDSVVKDNARGGLSGVIIAYSKNGIGLANRLLL